MMTGSRNQYVITRNPKTQKYSCSAKYNCLEQRWSDHSNSPQDSSPALWNVDWPTVGGGGDMELELNENELYKRVVVWDEHNYLVAAATSGSSDKQSTDGIVDNHAYSVIDSRSNICNTGLDLLLIRNPWGEGGELKNGTYMCLCERPGYYHAVHNSCDCLYFISLPVSSSRKIHEIWSRMGQIRKH